MNEKSKPKNPNRRNALVELDGVECRITFHDTQTNYIRVERGDFWKAKAKLSDVKILEPAST